MPRIIYQGRVHEARAGQTVLDVLLEGGEPIAHACRVGACGACIVRATEGQPPAQAQVGLRDAWRAQGYFHACRAEVSGDLVVEPLGEGARVAAQIEERAALSPTVARVFVRLLGELPATAGQYVTLHRGHTARSYSIAALPAPGILELHVRRVPGGALSPYLCDDAAPGDPLLVQGPLGHCIYVPGRPEDPLLLAGTGTGLAPLWGVLHDALSANHRGPIYLFHGALTPGDLYLVEELRQLAATHPGLRYVPSAVRAEPDSRSMSAAPPELELGPLDEVIARHLPSTSGMRAFLCGAPEIVALLKRKLYLAGTSLRDIAADAFVPTAPPAASTR
ncbi:MAG: 2Fe-2S iron-sulfur cluster binding domain-containing protein [Myxococcales bacterium]|nr:2Fe-2S iron-sulfur cluster binding domain-containing protein [Myxococcales bacterium]